MNTLWNVLVEPALRAAGARRVVEIGAFRGATTERLVAFLAPDGELDVIDPEPLFDPDALASAGVQLRMHRGLSHDVLTQLATPDAVLIDGDHNWFTVAGELERIAARAAAAGVQLPLILMHDVGWPYGRRDLYYAPERIPAEFRHPHAARGIKPGKIELAGSGGLNPHLENALHEGGARNGVLTALEDFIAADPEELSAVVVPVDHGLALVASVARLGAAPELANLFARIESGGRPGSAWYAEIVGQVLVAAGMLTPGRIDELRSLAGGGQPLEVADVASATYLVALGGAAEVPDPQREELAIALARFGLADSRLLAEAR